MQFESEEDVENLFFDRFIVIPKEDLHKINFLKHILNGDSKFSLMGGNTRSGSTDDAMELLSVVVTCHRTVDGEEEDNIDVNYFLHDNKVCRDRFTGYLQSTAKEQKEQAKSMQEKFVENVKTKVKKREEADRARPMAWDEVRFKPLDIQEGEGITQVVEDVVEIPPVPDPLGIVHSDLRKVQESHAEEEDHMIKEEEAQREERTRRMSMLSPGGGGGTLSSSRSRRPTARSSQSGKGRPRRASMTSNERLSLVSSITSTTETGEVGGETEETADGDPSPAPGATMLGGRRRRGGARSGGDVGTDRGSVVGILTAGTIGDLQMDLNSAADELRGLSVIPHDKNFSTVLFLKKIHDQTTFSDLVEGLRHLNAHLAKQSDQRQALVRQHFGLFVHCAEGLEWLKNFRKGQPQEAMPVSSAYAGVNGGLSRRPTMRTVQVETGDAKLKRAQESLDKAKIEAQNTLAPILDRMKKSKKLKNAEEVLKRWSSTLEQPHKMRVALEKEDYDVVLSLFRRVQSSLPTNSTMRIVNKVRDSVLQIVTELKAICIKELAQPDIDVTGILKYLRILYEIEDEKSCRESMRTSFNEQLKAFATEIQKIYETFRKEVTQGFMRGQEINLHKLTGSDDIEQLDPLGPMANSTNIDHKGSMNSSGHTMSRQKTKAPRLNSRAITLKAVKTMGKMGDVGSSTPQPKAARASFNQTMAIVGELNIFDDNSWKMFLSRSSDGPEDETDSDGDDSDTSDGIFDGSESSYSSESELDDDLSSFGSDNEGSDDDEIVQEGDDFDLDGLVDVAPAPKKNLLTKSGKTGKAEKKTEDDISVSDNHSEVAAKPKTKKRRKSKRKHVGERDTKAVAPVDDYCVLFCDRARLLFVQRLVSAVDIWLPSLHRFVVLLAAGDPFCLSLDLNLTGGNKDQHLVKKTVGETPVSRRRYAQYVRDGIQYAQSVGQLIFNCSEVIRMVILGFPDLAASPHSNVDRDIGLTGTLGGAPTLNLPMINLVKDIASESSKKNVLAHAMFQKRLDPTLFTVCIVDVAELYEGLDALIAGITTNASDIPLSFGRENSKPEEHSSISTAESEAFQPSVEVFRDVSQHGEVVAAQVSIDQLIDKTIDLVTHWQEEHYAHSQQGFEEALTTGYGRKKSLEFTAKQLEMLILKSLRATAGKSKRPEWVSDPIRTGIISVVRSFVENIRLKGLSFKNTDVVDFEDPVDGSESFASPGHKENAPLVRHLTKVSTFSLRSSELVLLEKLDLELQLDSARVAAQRPGGAADKAGGHHSHGHHSHGHHSHGHTHVHGHGAAHSNIDAFTETLLDVMRTCILVRTEFIPRVWRDVHLRFPLAKGALTGRNASSRGTFQGAGGIAMGGLFAEGNGEGGGKSLSKNPLMGMLTKIQKGFTPKDKGKYVDSSSDSEEDCPDPRIRTSSASSSASNGASSSANAIMAKLPTMKLSAAFADAASLDADPVKPACGDKEWNACMTYQCMMFCVNAKSGDSLDFDSSTSNIQSLLESLPDFIEPNDHGGIISTMKAKLINRLFKNHFSVHQANQNTVKINEGIESNVCEIISLEVDTMSKYLNKCGELLRTTVYAGYTILAKSENRDLTQPATGIAEARSSMPRLPPHLSRVLLILGNEQVSIELYLIPMCAEINHCFLISCCSVSVSVSVLLYVEYFEKNFWVDSFGHRSPKEQTDWR